MNFHEMTFSYNLVNVYIIIIIIIYLFIYLFIYLLAAIIGFAGNSTMSVSESVGSVNLSLSNISGVILVPFAVSITAEKGDRDRGS